MSKKLRKTSKRAYTNTEAIKQRVCTNTSLDKRRKRIHRYKPYGKQGKEHTQTLRESSMKYIQALRQTSQRVHINTIRHKKGTYKLIGLPAKGYIQTQRQKIKSTYTETQQRKRTSHANTMTHKQKSA